MTASTVPDGARASVVTVSNRSYAGTREDTAGPLLADGLRDLGFAVSDVIVVPDEVDRIQAALQAAVDRRDDLVVTTGGTGFTPQDVTPEATRPLLEREAPGLADAVRQQGRDAVPTAILSRGVAGIVGGTIVVNLPGSPGGVRDGVAALAPVIGHAVAQLRGGDH
ncbi:MAG TPA: MogA/MoaB family molybdenum cofactor biosynthesis protein [Mycobacteriales bacterium]|nr:MogA/MoaB family molybdenum cofactor biosynthesis protein [Mycobacteriales bacterium]